jgi:hypothetical protein
MSTNAYKNLIVQKTLMGKQKRKWKARFCHEKDEPKQRKNGGNNRFEDYFKGNPNRIQLVPTPPKVFGQPQTIVPCKRRMDSYEVSQKIREVIDSGDYKGSDCLRVLDELNSRLAKGFPYIPLGKVRNIELPIKYIKPNGSKVPILEKEIKVTLTPAHHTNYVVVLANDRPPSVILVMDEGKICGAANMSSYGIPSVNYPDRVYTQNDLLELFGIPIIKPLQPSMNYQKL